MKLPVVPFLALVAVLAIGCGTVSYSPYVGEQEDWPIAKGAFVKTKDGIPIYRGLPSRPYTVLGHMVITTDMGAEEMLAVSKAKANKADAILFVDSTMFASGSFGGGTGYAFPAGRRGAMATGSAFSANTQGVQLTALLIKWKEAAK